MSYNQSMPPKGFDSIPKAQKDAKDTEKAPAFIREFSRESNSEERDALAEKIRNKRSEHFQERREQSELEKQNENSQKQLAEYNGASFLNKARDYFKMRAIREQLGMTQERKTEIDTSISSRDTNQEGQKEIHSLYEKEKEKWANTEYGKEDIARLFTEEHLASLSVEDYALLMKRFSSEMVTHVTRQGIRDHTGMWEHNAGDGSFHAGFEKMLDDGNLKSPLAIKLAERGKENAVLDYLTYRHGEKAGELPQSRKEALMILEGFLNNDGAGGYADKAAIHFAAEEVADYYYGSEKGNEIFVAYPSVFIGSQYRFSHGDIAPKHIDSMHNDAWVLAQEERGIKLDAALVFLPQDAQVDPRNGSRYEIGPDNKPLKNEVVYGGLERLATSPELKSMTEQIQNRLGRLSISERLPSPSTWESEISRQQGWDAYPHRDVLEALLPIRDKIREITGISDDRVLEKIFNHQNAGNLKSAEARLSEDERNFDRNYTIEGIMEQSGTRFVEAQSTISSEQYWQQYFVAHPDKKPSKVIFYSGGDPTKAMAAWKREHGLNKDSSDTSAGFVEHRTLRSEEHLASMQERTTRFEALARAVIDERYPE